MVNTIFYLKVPVNDLVYKLVLEQHKMFIFRSAQQVWLSEHTTLHIL